jgi:two-component system OmpR family sensor kinase
MKVPDLSLPRIEMPRLGLVAFRRRIIVRGVFLLLAAATSPSVMPRLRS